MRKGRALLAIGTIATCVALGALPGSASASAFCEEGLVHNYAKPLKQLAPPHYPPIDEHLPFAPARVFLGRTGSGPLIVGSGEVGYRLDFSPRYPGHHFSPPLHWHVVARFARIDSRGATIDVIQSYEREVGRLRAGEDRPSGDLSLVAKISEPGLYRAEITFSDSSGKRLAHYGEYFRGLRPISDVDLSLNGSAFRPGETVVATLENRGTDLLSYGLRYTIENFDGSSWSSSPINPSGPVLAIGLGMGPGGKSSCWAFQIPANAPAGPYRFTWSGDRRVDGQASTRSTRLYRSAEFTILPPG